MASDNTRLYSILAYIGPLFLVGLLSDKDNPKVMFHVNQGLTLFLAEFAVFLVSAIIGITNLGLFDFISAVVNYVGGLACFVLAIMGILNANNGVEKELPVIGQFKLLK
ncbi:MAG TPA: hypothetical protein VIL27_10290 [Clostridia bacterium]